METLHSLLLENELDTMEKSFCVLMSRMKEALLNEDVRDLSHLGNDMEAKFAEAEKRLAAARRGLVLANKLPDPAQKKENQSRVLRNTNYIRKLLRDLSKEMEAKFFAAQHTLAQQGNANRVVNPGATMQAAPPRQDTQAPTGQLGRQSAPGGRTTGFTPRTQ